MHHYHKGQQQPAPSLQQQQQPQSSQPQQQQQQHAQQHQQAQSQQTRVTSMSPPRTQRAPRASAPAQPTGVVVGALPLRPLSPPQSARARLSSGPGSTIPTSTPLASSRASPAPGKAPAQGVQSAGGNAVVHRSASGIGWTFS